MILPVESLPGPDDIVRRELPNGIVVLVRENFNARSVVMAGSLNAGAVFDPAGSEGLAAFTAASLLRGTETRDFAAIHETLESNGASLSISAGLHTVGFSGKGLAEDLPMLLDLLSDALRHPAFPAEQVERLRGQLVTGFKIREQDTRYMAGRTFRELAYPPSHPYSRLPEGRLDTLAALLREQLAAFHARHYGPRGMLVIVVGAVTAERVISLMEQCFADWSAPDQPDLPLSPDGVALDSTRTQMVALPGKSQVDLVLGVPGPSRRAEDWQAATLANAVLGVFGMYGRIGAEVREKRGLAYYSYSRVDGGMGPGPWRVIAGVNPANVERALDAIRGEIRRIVSEPVGEVELADVKANFIGRLPLQLETNEGVAGSILSMERYGLGLDYLRRYPTLVSAVTPEAALAAAQHYLDPDVYALAIAGPELTDAPGAAEAEV
ncbi:M16 family metallopeptidase [Aggregatilinea lenta]|uniref:M16 family metallopeptidase n=1 Tax=Aggregatilinea lenta TaxID=913108 RepID=UPI000E5BD819|nr:pitrilysin family protein [Aggregatilinea lenta]